VTGSERLAGRLAFPMRALLDALAVIGVRAEPRTDQKRVVLVVRLDAIGDYLLWSRFALDLAALYPAAGQWRALSPRSWLPQPAAARGSPARRRGLHPAHLFARVPLR